MVVLALNSQVPDLRVTAAHVQADAAANQVVAASVAVPQVATSRTSA